MYVRMGLWMGLAVLVALFAGPRSSARADDDKIKVVVVAVFASDQHEKIDNRLKDLAPVLKKKDSSWTGFEVERASCEWLKVGEKHSFLLADELEVTVILQRIKQRGCAVLLIRPPTLGEVEFSCCCDKFFPIITRYETKDKKRLVIAVMVKSCEKK